MRLLEDSMAERMLSGDIKACIVLSLGVAAECARRF
jgi:hypothetical protein